MGNLCRIVTICSFVLFGLFQPKAQADAGKEFITSCTYGVLAGTLVGAATLAFEENPGDNLNKVARGASIGLYVGILLGLYVVYVVPNQLTEPDVYQDSGEPLPEELPPDQGLSTLKVYPLISQNGVEGMGGHMTLLSF